jgi:hypothetical protein
MGQEPEAGRPEKPPKRKMTPEGQSELFIRTARELGVDETGEEFERAFAKIVHPGTNPLPADQQPKTPSSRRSKDQA